MSNHSPEFDPEMAKHLSGGNPNGADRLEEMKSLLQRNVFAGATGNFPQGKLTKSDEGEIQFTVGAKNNKVILQFGTPVAWMGMSPEQAVDLGEMLIQKAAKVGFVRPVRIEI